jgi:predicted ATPase
MAHRTKEPENRIGRSDGARTIQEGPIRHRVLPDKLLQRIEAFKEILREVDNATLDEVVDDFKRDAHPEQEIAVWERIAHTYALFLLHNPTGDLAIKREIFLVVLMASLGVEDGTEIRHLTTDQIRQLVLNYKGL